MPAHRVPRWLVRRNANFNCGFLAIAVVVALLFSMSWSAAGAQARVAASCSTQVDRARVALSDGRRIDAAQMSSLRGCVLSQPALTADSLALGQADSATAQNAAAPATVLASFRTSLSGEEVSPLCLNFNSDGTITSPFIELTVQSAGYLGTPGILTLFSLNLTTPGAVAFNLVGLSIGPVLVAVPTAPAPIPFLLGLQVPSC
jgi:hypothetical protein